MGVVAVSHLPPTPQVSTPISSEGIGGAAFIFHAALSTRGLLLAAAACLSNGLMHVRGAAAVITAWASSLLRKRFHLFSEFFTWASHELSIFHSAKYESVFLLGKY